ncbi:double-stranded RNA-binding protein 2-like [Canna indica]|uniref:Double-stranded RNA-binding protein 2-like n=1 Tax=Canna indica TaxID=4628 RepID=A0AAQ3Q320_9LILI|nr:double-stranded RNA-binding protein 2-like [Canna indica]
MYKNQLQELAQRSCFNLPSYACIREGPDHAPRFKATVNFNGEIFASPAFCSTLRQAEHAAAEVALYMLSKRGPSRSLTAKVLDETGMYKNLLQETAHRAGLKLPVYTTVRSGPGHTPIFTCTVELAGISFTGDPAKTKKQAQKNAAMAAWSSLKQLQHLGPSSSSSSSMSSSLLEHEGNEEQEQVVVARALANLHKTEGEKYSQSERPHCQRSQVPIHRGMRPTSARCSYSVPFQSWTYPHFSSKAVAYKMWHQAQASEQQANFLSLPANPQTMDPRFLPLSRSTYQPIKGQFFKLVEQDPGRSLPCLTRSTPSLAGNASGCPVSVQSRNWSLVTIKEVYEEQMQEEGKEGLTLPSEEAVCSLHTLSGSSVPSDDNGAVVKIHNPLEEKEGKQSRGDTEVSLEQETNNNSYCVKLANSASRTPILTKSDEGIEIQECQLLEKSERKLVEGQPMASICPEPQAPNPSLIPKQITNSFDIWLSHRFNHPSSIVDSPVMARLASGGALRPRAPSLAAPVMMRSATPVCSSRSTAVNLNVGVTLPRFMAAPVRVRSIIPVCSAPVRKPEINQVRGHEKEAISGVGSEFGKLQI